MFFVNFEQLNYFLDNSYRVISKFSFVLIVFFVDNIS